MRTEVISFSLYLCIWYLFSAFVSRTRFPCQKANIFCIESRKSNMRTMNMRTAVISIYLLISFVFCLCITNAFSRSKSKYFLKQKDRGENIHSRSLRIAFLYVIVLNTLPSLCCCCLPCNHYSNWTWVAEYKNHNSKYFRIEEIRYTDQEYEDSSDPEHLPNHVHKVNRVRYSTTGVVLIGR